MSRSVVGRQVDCPDAEAMERDEVSRLTALDEGWKASRSALQ
jgi:hypothetical protein